MPRCCSEVSGLHRKPTLGGVEIPGHSGNDRYSPDSPCFRCRARAVGGCPRATSVPNRRTGPPHYPDHTGAAPGTELRLTARQNRSEIWCRIYSSSAPLPRPLLTLSYGDLSHESPPSAAWLECETVSVSGSRRTVAGAASRCEVICGPRAAGGSL